MTRHAFAAAIRIARPVDKVFALASDPTRFPLWNSAVTSVRPVSATTYVMHRKLPTGRAENGLELVERTAPATFTIRTTYGPMPFTYCYSFTSEGEATLLELDAEAEIARLLGPLLKRGVEANLATLKELLEG